MTATLSDTAPPTAARERSSPRAPLTRVLWTGLLLIGIGLGAELGARAYDAVRPGLPRHPLATQDPLAVNVEPHGDHGFRQKPGSTFPYANGTHATSNAQGFRGPVVAIPKPPNTVRIILLGGSGTHGWEVNDGETIDRYLREELSRRVTGSSIEVVNLAFDGYDSYQDWERLRSDGIRFEPDIVIVNSGTNDVRNARLANLRDADVRTLTWENVMDRLRAERTHGPSLWTRVKHWSYIARALAFYRTRQKNKAAAPKAIVTHPEAADYFEKNLMRIAEVLHGRGVALVLSVPPSSLTTRYAPRDTSSREYWLADAAETQRYRDELARRMEIVADSVRARGDSAAVVRSELEPSLFIDDAHLTPEGNAALARALANDIEPLVRLAAAKNATVGTNGPQR